MRKESLTSEGKQAINGSDFVATVPEKRNFQFRAVDALLPFLKAYNVSLGFTTYQIGKIFLVGIKPDATGLSFYERTFEQPMGLVSSKDGHELALGTKVSGK